MPFASIVLKSQRLTPYRNPPKTLGDHLKKKRFISGALQKEVAAKLGVNVWTYGFWENDQTFPVIGNMPRIIEYLGYYPFKEPKTAGERVIEIRRRLGLSQRELARRLGLNEEALRTAESGSEPNGKFTLAQLENYLAWR